MRLPEAASVLRDHIQWSAETAPGFSIHGMGMACSVDVWAGGVDGGVDAEGCLVYWFVALYNVAVVVDEDEVGDFYLGEVLG